MSSEFDLAIVGGGLGGATLARCIAAHGARVLVLERDQQFKDRVRGEFLTPWGVAEARTLGVETLLRQTCAHEVPWVDFFSGTTLTAHRDVPATNQYKFPCLSFYHPAMQSALIMAAARAGAEVRRGVMVHEVRPGAPAVLVAGSNGRREEIRARMIVGADGRSSSVRASAGFAVRRDPDLMLVAGVLLENIPAPEDTGQIIINSTSGRLAALFPQGAACARAYLCYQTATCPRYQGAADLPRFIADCVTTGVNRDYFEYARQAGPLATFDGADSWVDHPFRDGVALIGDAAAATDPTWGQGLALTLRDARLLSDQLLATEDWNVAGHRYAGQHDFHSGVIRTVTGWLTEMYLALGPERDARRARALPLIVEDPTRQPDTLFCGPDRPFTEADRVRFFAEGVTTPSTLRPIGATA